MHETSIREPAIEWMSVDVADVEGTKTRVESPAESEWEESAADRPSLVPRALALAMLLVSLPLQIAIALIILISDGLPIIYRNRRLGKGKQPFTMYKLRTLVRGAEQVVGGDLLKDSQGLTLPFGRFLRDTRLDELPQLWNIVRGDMSFVGPRPERPEVYRKHCSQIGSYDRRFAVRPGLIGPSQLFTPHNTPKRFRTIIDNSWLQNGRTGLQEIGVVLYTATLVGAGAARRLWFVVLQDSLPARVFRRVIPRRKYRRVRPARARVELRPEEGEGLATGELVDLSARALRLRCDDDVSRDKLRMRITIELPGSNGLARTRTAECRARLFQARRREGTYDYVVMYEPLSDRSEYIVQQYFLDSSLGLTTRRPWVRKLMPGRWTH